MGKFTAISFCSVVCNVESLMDWSALTHKGCLFCFVGIQNEQKHSLGVVTQIMSLQKPYEHNANMTSEILPLALRTQCVCISIVQHG